MVCMKDRSQNSILLGQAGSGMVVKKSGAVAAAGKDRGRKAVTVTLAELTNFSDQQLAELYGCCMILQAGCAGHCYPTTVQTNPVWRRQEAGQSCRDTTRQQ